MMWVMTWVQVLLAVALGIVLAWIALVAVLLVTARDRVRMREALRLLPDLLRLIAALVRDDRVPVRVRWMLAGLAAYLALPIDLIPDFLPVIGYADDALVTAIVLRFTVRAAGRDAITRNWRGSPEGLEAVLRLAAVAHPD